MTVASKALGTNIKLEQQTEMFRLLSALVNASINLSEAFLVLEETESDPALSGVYNHISCLLQSGRTLSSSLQESSNSFLPHIIALVKLGEETGAMPTVLSSISENLESRTNLTRKIKAALIYPVVLAATSSLVMAALLFYFLPRMLELVVGLNVELPIALKVLATMMKTLSGPTTLFLLPQVFLFSILLCRRLTKDQKFLLRFDRALLSFPLLGNLSTNLNILQFSESFRTLLKAGCPIFTGLGLVGPTLTNRYLSSQLLRTREDIMNEGLSLAESLSRQGAFPKVVHQLIAAGEESGALDRSLASLSYLHTQRTEEALTTITAIFEPAVLIVMGAMVGLTTLGFFLPLTKVIAEL